MRALKGKRDLPVKFLTITLFLISVLFTSQSACPADQDQNASTLKDASALQQSIDTPYKSGEKSISIPPGTYKFAGKPPWTKYFLNFKNMHDFEIEATGVTLVVPSGGVLFRQLPERHPQERYTQSRSAAILAGNN